MGDDMANMLTKVLAQLQAMQAEQKEMANRQTESEAKMDSALNAMKASAPAENISRKRSRSRSRSPSRSRAPSPSRGSRRSPRIQKQQKSQTPNKHRKRQLKYEGSPDSTNSESSATLSRSSSTTSNKSSASRRCTRSKTPTNRRKKKKTRKRTPKPEGDKKARRLLTKKVSIFDGMLFANEFQLLGQDGKPSAMFDYDKYDEFCAPLCDQVCEGSKDATLAAKCQRWLKGIGSKRRRYLQNDIDPEKRESTHLTLIISAH